MRSTPLRTLIFLVATVFAAGASAGIFRNSADTEPLEDVGSSSATASARNLPAGTRVLRNVAYGSDAKQTMDIYMPAHAEQAPVIFMVHGGAWRIGDKAHSSVVDNKVARWLPQGFIFISINYRMLPELDALHQADDVARALAFAQAHAKEWGGDPTRFIAMGHSAGAHLVALLSATPDKAYAFGAQPWLGSVVLDSAAMDVTAVMQRRHPRFYDAAFGSNPNVWEQASPQANLSKQSLPMYAVCSTQRKDNPCAAANSFMQKAIGYGDWVDVLPQNLSHGEINQQLGLPGSYTYAVERFMRALLG